MWRIRENQNGSNSLTHHGILGMKWGVRRTPEQLGHNKKKHPNKISDKTLRKVRYEGVEGDDINENDTKGKLTDKQKKVLRNVAIGGAAALGIAGGMYLAYKYDAVSRIDNLLKGHIGDPLKDPGFMDEASKAMKDSLKDTDLVFKKGQVFHRIESIADRDFSKVSSATYVSVTEKDRYTYMTQLKDWSGSGKKYEVTMEAIKDIRAPSKETARKVFDELWNKDPEYKDQLIQTIADAHVFAIKKQNPGYFASIGETKIKQLAMQTAKSSVKQDPFGQAMYSIVRRQADSQKLISELQKLGYDAIEDYFDKGSFTEQPMILFDPSSSIVKTGEQFVDRMMKVKASAILAKNYSK